MNKFKLGTTIFVNDKMQSGYSYILAAEPGQDFHPDFKPELSPQQMLELGVFEGHYMTDCTAEFPPEWFKKASLSPAKPDINKNYFKIKSRLPLQEWQKRGWIKGHDVRGWFQWYCRYWLGRRLPELDEVQIKRWRAFKRHKMQILKNCPPGAITCRPRQRQALLQWAYDPFF